jgi:putative transposase
VLAVKQVNTTILIKEHKKYSYKLRGLNISHANHVWSTDITYIKIAGGMAYMAAIIDWHSKAVLSHRISNTMDGKGRATDNICIKRFWRSAKVERIYLNAYQSIGELITDVDDYIEFYNHRRFHETLDYKKPMDVCQESIKLNQEKARIA